MLARSQHPTRPLFVNVQTRRSHGVSTVARRVLGAALLAVKEKERRGERPGLEGHPPLNLLDIAAILPFAAKRASTLHKQHFFALGVKLWLTRLAIFRSRSLHTPHPPPPSI